MEKRLRGLRSMEKRLRGLRTWLFLLLAMISAIGADRACAEGPARWLPVCPDGLFCHGTSFRRDGNIVIGTSDGVTRETRFLSLSDYSSTPAPWFCGGFIMPSGNCLAGQAFYGGTVLDPAGNSLYTFNPVGYTAFQFAASNGSSLGSLYFTGTSPPTFVSGFATAGQGGQRYWLTSDEARTWQLQTPAPQRFVVLQGTSPDGFRIWGVSPRDVGLWQTRSIIETGGQLDLTQFNRVDDGSFPEGGAIVVSLPATASMPGGYTVALGKTAMAVSTDFGRTWITNAFAGHVDGFVFPHAGNVDIQAIAARGSIYLSRDRGQTWAEIGLGLPDSIYSLSARDGTIIASGEYAFVCPALDCVGPRFARVIPFGTMYTFVTEFHNAGLDHYFLTGDDFEKAFIRSGGAGAGWVETGQNFWAWSQGWVRDSAYVCRFYGDAARGPNSHFYSASSDECRGLLALQRATPDGQPRWNSEGYAFRVGLPADGHCTGTLLPVYRAYNNGYVRHIDGNHRYVGDRSLLAPLLAAGWVEEGIAFCIPPAGHE